MSIAPHGTSTARSPPQDLYRSALTALRVVLPRPLTCNPADTTDRDLEAMAQVTALRPADAAEVALAVQFVVSHALALDIMPVITESPIDALKLWAASANMMRQSRGALSSLLRLRAVRMKEARHAAAVDDADPAPSVTPSGTESRSSGNETAMRLDSGPAAPIASPHSAPAPIEPDRDLMVRLAADPALKKPPNTPPRYVSRHASSASRFIPCYETVSRVLGFETGVRQTDLNLTPTAHETESRLSGNETAMRLVPRTAMIAGVPGSETEFRSSGNETATRLTTPAFVSASETEFRSSGNETAARFTKPSLVSLPETESRSAGNETEMR